MVYNGKGSNVYLMAERLLLLFENMWESSNQKGVRQVKKQNLVRKPVGRVLKKGEKAELVARLMSLKLGREGMNQIMEIVKKRVLGRSMGLMNRDNSHVHDDGEEYWVDEDMELKRYRPTQTRNISIEESVGIFLMTLAHGCTNRFVQESFNNFGETIHRHFYKVLAFVLKMSAEIIKLAASYNHDVPAHILNNPRYYPLFKDCICAIDGTHVRALVRLDDQPKYIGRKGYATQNIMVACDFNMCFTFVWAGWEGTAHDTRIFNEALLRPDLKFPHPAGDKYCVVDVGYPDTKGYLAPYKGVNIRYHIPDFQRGHTSVMRAPRGSKETFNYYHSSLRNIIERTFGVWKARWALLRDMHVNYTCEHQVKIALASMAIHNFIRKAGKYDEAFETA
ncbi:uncharacterized protein LOC143605503 [Bidens hawaiensis]|uniref:uncharacterized protein LOC143605503 n=1 Tax=Bidens hawaiensis TaxID=980011 RepID=UPI004049BAED